MRRFAYLGLAALLLAACVGEPLLPLSAATMEITSPAFEQNGRIPSKYTCDGEHVSPPLIFADVPEGTQSLMLIVDDPDAPNGDWVHWVVYNIDPSTETLVEGTVPSGGAEGKGSGGNAAYAGPCPPSGTHRYFFKLYALDTKMLFEVPPTKAEVQSAMDGHTLASAELIGLYERRQ